MDENPLVALFAALGGVIILLILLKVFLRWFDRRYHKRYPALAPFEDSVWLEYAQLAQADPACLEDPKFYAAAALRAGELLKAAERLGLVGMSIDQIFSLMLRGLHAPGLIGAHGFEEATRRLWGAQGILEMTRKSRGPASAASLPADSCQSAAP